MRYSGRLTNSYEVLVVPLKVVSPAVYFLSSDQCSTWGTVLRDTTSWNSGSGGSSKVSM